MTPRERISEAALDELRQRNPVDEIAGKWVHLRRSGGKFIGPCPMCSSDRASRTATRFECTSDHFLCAVCVDGGDVIRLVEKAEGKSFLDAVAWLGGVQEPSAERAAELEAQRKRRDADRERQTQSFRERERRTLWDIWLAAAPIAGSPAERYLALRGLDVPPRAKLRCVVDMPYFVEGAAGKRTVIARAPAMIAPILRPDAHFGGLHFTYLDLNEPKGKARITDPETGELLPAKKSRGSKKAGYIELVGCDAPKQMIIGEGIEKVLAVWCALTHAGADLPTTIFRTSVDLGNLGGKATGTLAHPTLKTDKGRAQRLPGPAPDLEMPAIPVPDSVDDIVILGDSTSDRLATECAIARAGVRWRREGRRVRVAWAPDGQDFDDLLRAA